MLSGDALVLLEEEGNVSSVILESDALDSVFIQLFLLGGEGQTVFEKVYDSCEVKETTMIQGRLDDRSSVSVWRVKME